MAAVALIDADGRVLLAQRPPGKAMAGLWEFPGGKVHADETPEAALVRELAEELGIDTAERCLAPLTFASHRYETFHLLMPLFACRNWRGTPTAMEGSGSPGSAPTSFATIPCRPPTSRWSRCCAICCRSRLHPRPKPDNRCPSQPQAEGRAA